MKKYTAKEVKVLILDSAVKQFTSRGFETTRVQDIMDPLDGLTKGAFYHHFKSKEEIADKVVERMLPDRNVFDSILKDTALNGLRKIQELFLASMFDKSTYQYVSTSFELLSSPRFFLKYIEYVNELLVPYLECGLEEGAVDGSLSVTHIRQTAELVTLVLSTWFINAIFPNTVETLNEKLMVAQAFLSNSNVNILDEYVLNRMSEEVGKNAKSE